MSQHWNAEANHILTIKRWELVAQMKNSLFPAHAFVALDQEFERQLDIQLPMGVLDDSGRDPDNLRGAQ